MLVLFLYIFQVFFRAGALALMEEKRDDIVTLLIRKLQGACFGHIKRKIYNKKKQQRWEHLIYNKSNLFYNNRLQTVQTSKDLKAAQSSELH